MLIKPFRVQISRQLLKASKHSEAAEDISLTYRYETGCCGERGLGVALKLCCTQRGLRRFPVGDDSRRETAQTEKIDREQTEKIGLVAA